jgi:prevent-host-death family protein
MNIISYGVRELQANLGRALRAAANGDRVIVTSRHRAVAVLSRLDSELPDESASDRKLRRLSSEGKIRLGDSSPIKPYEAVRIGGLSDLVLSDRR